MDLKDKTIGFAMCGSRSTMILIQLNYLWSFGQSGCIIKLYGCKVGAYFNFEGAKRLVSHCLQAFY